VKGSVLEARQFVKVCGDVYMAEECMYERQYFGLSPFLKKTENVVVKELHWNVNRKRNVNVNKEENAHFF